MKKLSIAIFSLIVSTFAHAQTGSWISLFDGKSLAGWEANESPESWHVKDGAIVAEGTRSHLFYVGDVADHNFKNFEFYALVKSNTGANSGIYIHTKFGPEPWPVAGYELQIYNASPAPNGKYIEYKKTGSIYAVRNTWIATAKDNEWFEYRIKVSGKTIQTFVNDQLISEYTENTKPSRSEDKLQRLLSSGTFAFQAHDPESIVRFKNIKVRILPDNAPTLGSALEDKELDQFISKLSNDNVALIDLGIIAGNQALNTRKSKDANKYGVTLGYKFPKSQINVSNAANAAPMVLINDKDQAPSVELMKAAKANGAVFAFSSGGVLSLDPARLKLRFKAIRDAGLSWQDMWIPGN